MTLYEVFLSHANANQQFADKLVAMLQRHGVPVWYSRINIVGAQQWHDEIGEALQRCDWFVVILSPESVESMWVKRELFFALSEKRFENKIIPVLYQPCNVKKLSWTLLSSFQIVDFTTSYEEGCQQLLRIWGMGYRNNNVTSC